MYMFKYVAHKHKYNVLPHIGYVRKKHMVWSMLNPATCPRDINLYNNTYSYCS